MAFKDTALIGAIAHPQVVTDALSVSDLARVIAFVVGGEVPVTYLVVIYSSAKPRAR
jgi:hypothetical protein